MIACQLSVSAGALFVKHIDSAQAQDSQAVETSMPVKTDHVRLAEAQKEATPYNNQIMSRLGSYGLELVDGPVSINNPKSMNNAEQFMVSTDSECAVQFGMTTDTTVVNVVTYLIGPEEALKNRRIYNQDGTKRGQTIHAEGEPAIGVEFPANPEDVPEVMAYLRENTDFFCNLLANNQ